MSNLFQTVTSGVANLKNFYQGPIVDALNEELAIYRACDKVKNAFTGQQVIRPVRLRRNQGIGATGDGGNLPSIGRQVLQQAQVSAKYNYLRFGVTAPMIKSSMNDKGSFVRQASYELEMGYKDLKSDLSRQLGWDGTCTLAAVNTASVASTSLVIQGRESLEEALKFIDVGMVVDIYNSTGATLKAAGVTVSSISSGTMISSTATLVLDTAVTTSVGDILVRSGSMSNEIQGLLYALDGATTTIYNIDRSSYLAYQGNVVDNGAAALSLTAMQNPFNAGLRRGNVGSYDAAYTDFTTLLYYQKLLTPDKRYANTVKGDGGFGDKGKFYLDFNGLPMVPDKDMAPRIMFLPSEVLKFYLLCEMEFADETGSMYIAQTDVDSWEVRIRHFGNMFNEQPAACAVLKNYISP